MNTILFVIVAILFILNLVLVFSYLGQKLNTYDDMSVKLTNITIQPKVYVVSLVSLRDGILTFSTTSHDSAKLVEDVNNNVINHILLDGTLYIINGITNNNPIVKIGLSNVGLRNTDQLLSLDSTNMTVMILGYVI
jgi:hypothetical protein